MILIVLGRFGGPDVQGTFSVFKTWIDLTTALLIFGFPQAFVYLINKKVWYKSDALSFSILHFIISLFLVIPIALYGVYLDYLIVPQDRQLWLYLFLISFGASAFCFNRLIRAIYLTIDDGIIFALITSAPAFILMIFMLTALKFNNFPYDVAYFFTGILTLLLTIIWIDAIIKKIAKFKLYIPTISNNQLFHHSWQSFAQSIAIALQPVIMIFLIFEYSGSVKDVAFFTSSTLIISAANVLFGIVAPLLFNRWSKKLDINTFYVIRKSSLAFTAFFLAVGILGIWIAEIAVVALFGSTYREATWAFQLMFFAMAPVALTRVLYPAIHAIGHPHVNTISCFIRVGAAAGLQLMFCELGWFEPLPAAILSWLIAEWVAAIYTWLTSTKKLMWPT